MRINVYSQELTDEVNVIEKKSNTGLVYSAVQLLLHSSPMLHHPPADTTEARSRSGCRNRRSAARLLHRLSSAWRKGFGTHGMRRGSTDMDPKEQS